MKKHLLFVAILSLSVGACAAGQDEAAKADAAGGSTGSAGNTGGPGGGTTGSGGSRASGGTPSSGGVTVTGGSTRSGGTTSSAASTRSGGTTSSAASTSSGGSSAASTSSGGTTRSGGTTGAGGTTTSGGTTATGGSTNSAGTSGSAGATATAGATSPGGSTSSGGTTASGGRAGGSTSSGGTTATGGRAGGSTSSGGRAGGSTSSGGTTVAGGSTSAGGSASSPGVCTFASGLNVAWVQFAGDVPNPNLTTFNTIFKNTYNAGGRVIRWWFHTNGTVTPGYDSSGKAQKIPQTHIDGVKAILNAAATNKVAINISLWSFDMLQGGESISATTLANNAALLSNDTNRQAYIDNYLTPLVTALKGTPGLYSYEIFNEPEGMSQGGWTTSGTRTTEAFIQKTVNWLAAAIHSADSTALVTNGAQTFDYCSGVSGKNNYYSDTALRNVGGKQNGTLDYYEVHYYASNGTSNSCFTHPASYWGLDKKLVMGEFAAAATDGTALADLYTKIYSTGYSGAWAWSYDADWRWPAMQTPMQNLYTAQKATIDSCP